jgi:uncharacterized delta-60 repeat protein
MRSGSTVAAAAWLTALAVVTPAHAGTNALDAAFGSGGFVPLGPAPSTGYVLALRALAIDSDGSILVGGRVGAGAAIGKLHGDGSWDPTFADHGVYVLPDAGASAPNGGEIHNIVILSDHSIVAAGGAYVNFATDFATCTLMLKLTSTGALDVTFGPDQSGSFCFDFAANTNNYTWFRHNEGFVVGADDSLYLTTPYTNLSHGAVAHFDSDGRLIGSYGNDGIASLPEAVVATRLQLTGDNQILTMGAINNAASIAVARLDAAGQIDNAYGSSGMITFDAQPGGLVSLSQALLDAQQRLVIADNDDESGVGFVPYRFARVTTDGKLDESFNGSGQQPGIPGFATPALDATNYFSGLEVALPLADGHVLGVGDAGYFADSDGENNLALVRLAGDASFDASFGNSSHPGWSSLNIGGGANGFTRVRATASDAGSGQVFIAIEAGDGNLHGCAGILRLIPDRLFDDRFDAAPSTPYCPQ